jgi:hypothetical protein
MYDQDLLKIYLQEEGGSDRDKDEGLDDNEENGGLEDNENEFNDDELGYNNEEDL